MRLSKRVQRERDGVDEGRWVEGEKVQRVRLGVATKVPARARVKELH
jgi:hypothetical protein